MVETQSDAIDVLADWHKTNQQLFADLATQTEFKQGFSGSASLELASSTYIMQVDVWNNAWAVDVQVINLATKESTFPIVGPNANRVDLEEKLADFLRWFKDAHQAAA